MELRDPIKQVGLDEYPKIKLCFSFFFNSPYNNYSSLLTNYSNAIITLVHVYVCINPQINFTFYAFISFHFEYYISPIH